jgi:hypothetical protein
MSEILGDVCAADLVDENGFAIARDGTVLIGNISGEPVRGDDCPEHVDEQRRKYEDRQQLRELRELPESDFPNRKEWVLALIDRGLAKLTRSDVARWIVGRMSEAQKEQIELLEGDSPFQVVLDEMLDDKYLILYVSAYVAQNKIVS